MKIPKKELFKTYGGATNLGGASNLTHSQIKSLPKAEDLSSDHPSF